MDIFYAGIGSRETPQPIRQRIHFFADRLNALGYVLRSGGADGADDFFEERANRFEIYLPWKGFNDRPRQDISEQKRYFQEPTSQAFEIASKNIQRFSSRKRGVQLLLARNMHQVLGFDLKTPVNFVICWTPEAKVQGGTAYAIRLAKSLNIPVFNLANIKHDEALQKELDMHPQQTLF